jgi:hypothetical protein
MQSHNIDVLGSNAPLELVSFVDADPLSLLRAARPPDKDILVLEPKWIFWFQTRILRMNTQVPPQMLNWLFQALSVRSHNTGPRAMTLR